MIDLQKVMEYRDRFNYFPKSIGVKTVELSEDRAVSMIEIDENHMNPNKSVHGGVLFTMADALAGTLVCVDGKMHTTISSSMQYASPVMEKGMLIAEAKFIKKGRKISYITVDIKDKTGTLICIGSFTFYNLNMDYDEYHRDEL